MSQKTLAGWLEAIILGAGVCGLFTDCVIFPDHGQILIKSLPEYAFCYWPWLIFL